MSGAVSFEAKLYAYRKDGKGIIVSFVLQPQDVPNELALADIGQRFGLALAQLRDGDGKEPPEQRKQPDNEARSEEARARYATSGEPERAISRAAMLCNDVQFQAWIGWKMKGAAIPQAILEDKRGMVARARETAAFLLRKNLGIDSRSRIGSEQAAYAAFSKLEAEFKAETGLMAEQR